MYEVDPWNSDLDLVVPGTTHLTLTPHEYGARRSVYEELWNFRSAQPLLIRFDHRSGVIRLALEGDLTGPAEGRAPRFPGLEVRPPVDRHRLLGKRLQYRCGKDALDENVFVEDDLFACV